MTKGELPTSPEFKAAAAAVKNFSKMPDNDDLLKFYSLYKVATRKELDPKPGALNIIGGYKWDAWKKLSEKEGITSEKAQKDYIQFYEDKKALYA